VEIRETPLLPIGPHKSWLGLDDEGIVYQFGEWFIFFVFDAVGINYAKECRQKSADQIWIEYRDKDEFVKPLLRNLGKIARELYASDSESVNLKQIAVVLFTKGKLERAADLIREFIEKRVKRDRLERAALPYNQRQKQDSKQDRPDGLGLFMSEQIKRNGKINVTQMQAKIEASQGVGYIVKVTADKIYFKNRDGSTYNRNGTRLSAVITGLSNRLKREKERLLKFLLL